MAIAQEIQSTLDYLKTNADTMKGAVSPDTQKNFTTSNGLQTYNLEAPAKLMFPQLTPILNNTPRVQGKGKQAEYKSITGINTAALNGWTAEGNSGQKVTTSFNDVIAVYKIFSLADGITFEAEWEGRGFQDVKALAVANLIRAMKIQEENNLLFGQNTASAANQQAPGAVGSIAAPSVTQATGQGGSIAAGTVYTAVVPWTGMGPGVISAVTTTTVSAGSSTLTVTPPTVNGQPILGFDIYMSTSSAAGPWNKVQSANLTAGVYLGGTIPGYGQMITNGAPVQVQSVPTNAIAPPTSDGTASQYAYNGYLAQTFGGQGAYTQRLNSTLSMQQLNNMFLGLWNQAKGDPDVLYANATESLKITNLTLGAGGTPYFVTVDNQNGATAGYRTARLTNPVTGTEVPVNVHPSLPQGNIMAMQRKLPGWYVPTDIPNVMAIDVVQDYTEIDYPPVYDPTNGNGDTWNVAVKCLSTYKLYMPLLQGVLTGILQG